MAEAEAAAVQRRQLIGRLFPEGLPRLWCPSLTHYDAAGRPDAQRIAKHLQTLAPYVKGLLVPGSTGDGWEMDPDEQQRVIELVLDVAGRLNLRLLIGVLRRDAEAARRGILETLHWLKGRTGRDDSFKAMLAAGVCGVTVCAPTGKDLPQRQIRDRLVEILDLGLPTALYQLPQVTLNEMAPETVAELAGRYGNFYLFKDSSGEDRVAGSGLDLRGVYLLRGAEGDYGRWLEYNGGPYNGFLLSTANCFPERLHRMIGHLEQGRTEEALLAIAPVEKVVARVFELVADLPYGNAFTNANKAIDHFLAHGREAGRVPPPRLHAGAGLPLSVLEATGQALGAAGLLPDRGYLHDGSC